MAAFIEEVIVDITASGVIFVIGLLWKSSIYPFLQSFQYTGVRLAGRWSVHQVGKTFSGHELSIIRNTTVDLKQTAYKLYGTAESHVVNGVQITKVNQYRVMGEIRNGLVLLNFLSADSSKIAVSTFLLQVGGNGDKLSGNRLYFGSILNTVDCIHSEWVKFTS